MAEAAANSKQLAEDIGDAVIALLCQDAVSQQIGHVVSALNETHDALAAGNTDRAGELLERLRAQSTMRSEQDLLDRMTGQTTAGRADAQGSVELF